MYQTSPKSQADLKFHNLKLVFDLVKQEGPISRASLAKRTGLSPTSMTRIVNVLKRIGLISEHSVAQAGVAGRPSTLLEICADAAYCLCVDAMPNVSKVTLVDMATKQAVYRELVTVSGTAFETVTDELNAMLGEMCRDAGIMRDRIACCGMSISGHVLRNGYIAASSQMQWADIDGVGILERVRSIVNNVVPSLPHFKKALNGFDKVYTINKETEALLPEKCKGNRLFELALADDLKRLDIAERNNEHVRIMFMGRLIEKKGVILLLDIVKAMPKNLNYELLIYGSGPLKDRIKEIISTDNLDNVKLVGAIEHSMISSAYRESDIFIMPSLRETSGNVLVEAMAHKLPIVALDMSICSDLKALDCGLFVSTEQGKDEIIGDFAKCLTRLVNDKSLRIRLGENGYNYVNDKLTWEQKFKEIYKDYI